MLTKMYSIRDSKTGIFHKPWYSLTDEDATRSFTMVVNNPKSENIFDFPEDFDLYFVGQYDDNKGTVESLDTPLHIIKAVALKQAAITSANV